MTAPATTTIRFLPPFVTKIKNGTKTATTRTHPYGRPGDVLAVLDDAGRPQGFSVRLTAVTRVRLDNVPERYFREEGFDLPDQFIAAWMGIYGSFCPDDRVWLHRFEVV